MIQIKAQCIFFKINLSPEMRTCVIFNGLLFFVYDLELIIDIYHGVGV